MVPKNFAYLLPSKKKKTLTPFKFFSLTTYCRVNDIHISTFLPTVNFWKEGVDLFIFVGRRTSTGAVPGAQSTSLRRAE